VVRQAGLLPSAAMNLLFLPCFDGPDPKGRGSLLQEVELQFPFPSTTALFFFSSKADFICFFSNFLLPVCTMHLSA